MSNNDYKWWMDEKGKFPVIDINPFTQRPFTYYRDLYTHETAGHPWAPNSSRLRELPSKPWTPPHSKKKSEGTASSRPRENPFFIMGAPPLRKKLEETAIEEDYSLGNPLKALWRAYDKLITRLFEKIT